MTQRYRFGLLLLAAALLCCAVVADRQGLGFVEFALAVSGLVAAVFSLTPNR